MADAEAELDISSPIGTRRAGPGQHLIWKLCDWPILPQEVRRRLRKRFARKIVGPFDIIHADIRLRLYPAENYCDRVLFGRGELPELAEHQALLPLLTAGMVFVDIGANIGTYSLYVAAQLQGDCTILAFEPHPRTYQKLVFNLQANSVPVSMAHNLGIGPESSEVDLWSDGGSNIGHTSMVKEGTSNPKISHRVSISSLLEVLVREGIDHIDLLKIDIEGFEDQALTPFFEKADRSLWPRAILIEIAHQAIWQSDLMGLLGLNGYREIFRTDENRLLVRDD